MIFETKRLILRPWAEEDANSLYKYASDPRIGPSAGWQAHTSVENSLEIIKSVLSALETYAIVDKKSNEPIGGIGLMIGKSANLQLPENEGEIGYWIGVPYWGQGLVPEAVKEIMRHAFEDLKLKKVWCGYFEGNIKSKRVQEKCGFIYGYTMENIYWERLNKTVTEHISCVTEDRWFDR